MCFGDTIANFTLVKIRKKYFLHSLPASTKRTYSIKHGFSFTSKEHYFIAPNKSPNGNRFEQRLITHDITEANSGLR